MKGDVKADGVLLEAKAIAKATGPSKKQIRQMELYAAHLGKAWQLAKPKGATRTFTRVRYVFTDLAAAEKWESVLQSKLLGMLEGIYVGGLTLEEAREAAEGGVSA